MALANAPTSHSRRKSGVLSSSPIGALGAQFISFLPQDKRRKARAICRPHRHAPSQPASPLLILPQA